MITTAFTALVGASVPVQAASMPGVSTFELVVAVADAGGVGMVPAPLLSPDELAEELGRVKAATRGVVGVNFLMPFLDPTCVPVAARGARIVEFFYGEPDAALVAEVHAGGALAGWQVGSVAEARAAEGAGVDFLVVQGTEAGGHVRGTTSLLPVLAAVLDAVRVPVVAAGGIATGRDLAAVLASGAAGARVGTRFIASTESGAHPAYVAAVLAASAEDTCLTEAFSVMWPHAPHRVLRSAIATAEGLPEGIVGETRHGSRTLPVPRFAVIAPTRTTTGNVHAMALYAGESVTNVDTVRPAADIVVALASDAERLLRGT